jgi:hypothetical protein
MESMPRIPEQGEGLGSAMESGHVMQLAAGASFRPGAHHGAAHAGQQEIFNLSHQVWAGAGRKLALRGGVHLHGVAIAGR